MTLANAFITFGATFAGVLSAFALNRWWDKRKSLELYGQQMRAAGHELAGVLSQFIILKSGLTHGEVALDERWIKNTALGTVVQNPLLQQHGGIAISIIFLSTYKWLEWLQKTIVPLSRAGEQLDEDARSRLAKPLSMAEKEIAFARIISGEEVTRLGMRTVWKPKDREIWKRYGNELGMDLSIPE